MKIIKNDLEIPLVLRTEKDYPIEGVEFIDIMPMIMKKESFQEIVDKMTEILKEKELDYIVVPEARGFLIGSAVAKQLNLGCIPIRKKEKLPPSTIEAEFSYQKEYGKDILCLPKLVDESYEGKKFCIIDDIYATGNTVKAIEEQIEKLGGNVIEKMVIINIINLNNEKNVNSFIEVTEE